MYELIVNDNGTEYPVFTAEDPRVVELMRQRHARSFTPGEATVREVEKKDK